MPQRLAVAREARGAVGQVAEPLLVADRDAAVGAVAEAVDALPALGGEERDHVVAGRDERDAVTDALDDAGALVAEHAGRVAGRVGAGGGVEVGVADAAGGEPDEHLARLRLGEVDLLDDERAAELLENCCADFHGASIVACFSRRSGVCRDRALDARVPSSGADSARRRLPFQLGTHASPAISVTTNGPLPALTNSATAFAAGSTIAIRLLPDLRHPEPARDDLRVAERTRRAGTVALIVVRGGIDAHDARRCRHPDRIGRRSRPAAADDRDRRRRLVFVAGSMRSTLERACGPDRAERPDDARSRREQREALDDAVSRRVDPLDVAAAVRRRPTPHS